MVEARLNRMLALATVRAVLAAVRCGMDGRRQRNALTAAESAVDALAGADPASARRNAANAVSLDQIGIFVSLPDAVARAAIELEGEGVVSDGSWDAIAAALPPGPLRAKVDDCRG